ncbi:Phosphoribosylamine--glycine ligase [Chlamydiales bacterium SCGC AG-110-M15]|nr:Phosphoribosylamine--glycine ligase [Chlamydiales bacterium SCGC AG-110-M15]
MKIAVMGSGAREHAIVWKLAQHHDPESISCIPGNGGIPNSHKIDISDHDAVKDYCLKKGVTTLIVGPEKPLAEGLVDHLQGLGIHIFGPTQQAANLESSKIWAKQFMFRHDIATAPFWAFESLNDAERIIDDLNGKLVVKYDGLAGGKGVVVCGSRDEAHDAIDHLRERYGERTPFIIEKRLSGPEVSIVAITDGKTVKLLPASRDHKRALDDDKGANTGGMGAICPVDVDLELITKSIIQPTIKGLQEEGIPYCGFLYFGVMMTEKGPMLLEYNVRLGDPEAEVILPMLKTDLLELVHTCCEGRLDESTIEVHQGHCVDLVLTSEGYPGKYSVGYDIGGIENLNSDTLLFHAGTRRLKDRLVTYGGRVLNVVCQGDSVEEAAERAYAECEKIHFKGVTYRHDIGRRGVLV